MVDLRIPWYGKQKTIGILAVLTFGVTSLLAVIAGAVPFLQALAGPLVPAVFVLGFFILIPLIAIMGEDFPLVSAADTSSTVGTQPSSTANDTATAQSPIDQLREEYATGKISEAEFERRLDRLVETEDLHTETDTATPERDRLRERE